MQFPPWGRSERSRGSPAPPGCAGGLRRPNGLRNPPTRLPRTVHPPLPAGPRRTPAIRAQNRKPGVVLRLCLGHLSKRTCKVGFGGAFRSRMGAGQGLEPGPVRWRTRGRRSSPVFVAGAVPRRAQVLGARILGRSRRDPPPPQAAWERVRRVRGGGEGHNNIRQGGFPDTRPAETT